MKEGVISTLGDLIQVKLVDGLPSLGAWDETTGEIQIRKDLPEAGKHVVLIHEILHLAESILKQAEVIPRRVNHEYITNASPIILSALVELGVITSLRPAELDVFIEEQLREGTEA